MSVIYSGDTIMAREAWGTPALPRAWINSVNLLRETYPRGKYYWLLLTSGFRTYRFLPVFWREFHPRFDAGSQGEQRRLLAHLAGGLFGKQFNAGEGIVLVSTIPSDCGASLPMFPPAGTRMLSTLHFFFHAIPDIGTGTNSSASRNFPRKT